jgi:hypothetical protein
MKKIVATLVAGIGLGILIGSPLHAFASSSESASGRRASTLAARVATLERKMRVQIALDLNYNQQILTLQSHKPTLTVSELGSGSAIVSPLSWGSTIGGVCIGGTPVGATFNTDYPAEMGTVSANGAVHVFNPTASRTLLLTSHVLCASIN